MTRRRSVLALYVWLGLSCPWFWADQALATDPFQPVSKLHGSMTITVVYNNVGQGTGLQDDWGFAALIVRSDTKVLFDTGTKGPVLLSNMAALGLDPRSIDLIVLSHSHDDHTGGLDAVLSTGVRPVVYLPRSFPADFRSGVAARTKVVEVHEGTSIADGIFVTGETGSEIVEQALALATAKGLVVITGCAHPGVVEMVAKARDVGHDGIYMVLGGFHLGSASEAAVTHIISEFRRMGVARVGPSHCTGDKAMALFRQAYGADFIDSGLGTTLTVQFE